MLKLTNRKENVIVPLLAGAAKTMIVTILWVQKRD